VKYEDFLELLKYRRSIRNFKPDPVPDEYITKLLDAAHYAMSGANGQPWEFIVVKNPEIRKKLFEAFMQKQEHAWYLEQMRSPQYRHTGYSGSLEQTLQVASKKGSWADAPVVIAVLEDRRKAFCSVLAAFEPPSETLTVSMAHCTAIIHLAAASLGLGSQRVDVNVEQPFREILGYPEPLRLNILIPVGYRASEPGASNRLPLENLVHFDRYDMSKYLSDKDFLQYIERNRSARKAPN
jgi:5,6-dimethylbenzimidazole synthase